MLDGLEGRNGAADGSVGPDAGVARAAELLAVVEEMARDHPDAVALRRPTGDGEHTETTYGELSARCDTYARALAYGGLRPGTRTCLMVPPGAELVALAGALSRIGAVPVLIDPGIAKSAVKACLERVAPEAFIGVPRAHAARLLLGWGRRSVRLPIVVGGQASRLYGVPLERLCARSAAAEREVSPEDADAERMAGDGEFAPDTDVPAPDPDSDPVAMLAFTSGATGLPKAVEYRARHMSAQLRMAGEVWPLEPGEVGMSTLPAFALGGSALGYSMVVPEMDFLHPATMDAALLVRDIRRFGVVGLFASPVPLDRLSRYCAEHGVVLDSLRAVVCGGASLDPRTAERLRPFLPVDAMVTSVYGATEVMPVSALESRELLGDVRRLTEAGHGTCVGWPLRESTVRVIVDTPGPLPEWYDGLEVPPGTVGEITVAGPSTTERYEGLPDRTALAKIREGGRTVHRMGDLGRFDQHGRLWLCGRAVQRVRTADGDLYPEQVEPVAHTVPGVRRSALVGVAPEDAGDAAGAPVAYVPVLCVEAEGRPDREERRRLAADVLARFDEFPHTRAVRHVLFHPGLPVDVRHNSKIDRPRLARWAARGLRGGRFR
ncbi:fatty acid CoA ligase family protein [Streptomyces sp. Z26]|uniref:fatty acid CoA ligase family protein n=1 Tax=Streptomyces sp. Z26 TaxID=2500177 RepID=UPI000F2952DF|nr:fatty acid CoA ligase family protein [Streptomyces sp. Z26]RLL68023.1 peptide synthase [Streptomyces sp. Z26]